MFELCDDGRDVFDLLGEPLPVYYGGSEWRVKLGKDNFMLEFGGRDGKKRLTTALRVFSFLFTGGWLGVMSIFVDGGSVAFALAAAGLTGVFGVVLLEGLMLTSGMLNVWSLPVRKV